VLIGSYWILGVGAVTLLSIILWRSREILDRRSAAGARPVSALEQTAKRSLVATGAVGSSSWR